MPVTTHTFEELFGPPVEIRCTRVPAREHPFALIMEAECGCALLRTKHDPVWHLQRGECALKHPRTVELSLTVGEMEKAGEALRDYGQRPEEWFPST